MSMTTEYDTHSKSWVVKTIGSAGGGALLGLGGGGGGGSGATVYPVGTSYSKPVQDSLQHTKLLLAIEREEKLAEEAKKKNLNFAVVVHEAIAEALRSLL